MSADFLLRVKAFSFVYFRIMKDYFPFDPTLMFDSYSSIFHAAHHRK